MAYRTDGTANFNFFINRQGPRGPQGIQGPEGFSPNVQVEEDQGNTFTLRVTNKDNFFITSNLREHKEDRGGDYIRYDRAGQLMYIGDPNFATTVKVGEVRLSTVDDLTAGSDTVALTPKVYKDDVTSRIEEVNQTINTLDANNVKVTGDQAIDGRKVFRDRIDSNYVYTDHVYGFSGGRIFTNEDNLSIGNTQKRTILYSKGSGITLNGDTDYILTQSKVTAGDNVAIEKTSSGIKISSTAQGDVTLAGDNSFTGNNTFDGETTFNGHTWTREQEAVNLNVTSLATMKNVNVSGTLTSNGEINAVSIKTAGIKNNQNNKYYLTQGSITAGDNVTIEETTDGVKISSTGGGSSAPENMVTTDTEQTITGVKTFSQNVNIQGHANGVVLLGNGHGAGRILADKDYGGIEIYGREYSSDAWTRLAQFFGTGVLSVARGVSINGHVAYHRGNLIAGDGIKLTTVNDVTEIAFTGGGPTTLPIATTTTLGGVIIGDGLNISENGTLSAQVTNTQYGQLLESIADLSTKIDNLTTRVRELETQIDGGIA